MPVSGGELIDFLYSAAFPSTGDSPSKFSKLLRKAKGRLDALAKANYPHGYTEEDGEIIPLVYDPKFGITYNPADLSRDD
ncbi:hypothetical protein SAMN02983003_2041 [Devosia enhydra]|uniref:Uncharacterized protein n=2 Tax=Devosia enhydra TaxID=665118 RepID=A0A1K2HY91_9HYPH|nr:hypothetical protein SAMN02983003_2041 [Devosia enhydra]